MPELRPYVYDDAPLATPESIGGGGGGAPPVEFTFGPETAALTGGGPTAATAGTAGKHSKKSRVKKSLACFKVFKAILARLIFAVHGFIAIWRVTVIYENNRFYYLCGTLGCLVLETVLSICIRQGEELKWFSPSVFFYLATVCPSVWFLELDRTAKATILEGERLNRLAKGLAVDFTNETRVSVPTTLQDGTGGLPIVIDLQQLTESDWLKIFEQALMIILIIGRWLLPKGELTRDQLSQLLLVYIGMAADIIEIFEAFREPKVFMTIELVYTTLALWTWSLMQFTLVLTATKARKPRISASTQQASFADQADYGGEDAEDSRGPCPCCWWCSADIWGILTTLILQDGPFLCLRLTFLFRYNVVSYSNVFFTIKNSLVIVLQVYRTGVLLHYSRKIKEEDEFHVRNGLHSHHHMRASKSVPDRLVMHRSFDTITGSSRCSAEKIINQSIDQIVPIKRPPGKGLIMSDAGEEAHLSDGEVESDDERPVVKGNQYKLFAADPPLAVAPQQRDIFAEYLAEFERQKEAGFFKSDFGAPAAASAVAYACRSTTTSGRGRGRPMRGAPVLGPRGGYKLFVKLGEGHSFTKETLEPAFAAHGTVTDCFVPDGKPFAFITYDTLESAQAGGDALNMTEINGTKIFCNPALPKDGAGGGGGGRNCHKCNQPGHFAKDCTGAASSSSSSQSDWGAPAAASAGGSAWGSTTTTTASTATESSGSETPSTTAPAATCSGWGTPAVATSSSGGWGATATPGAPDVPSAPAPVVTATSGWGEAPPTESAKVEPATSGWGSSSSMPVPAAGGWGSSEPAVAAVSSGGWGSDSGTASTSSWGGDAGSSAAPPARGGHSGRGRGRPMRGAPVLGPRGGYKLFVKLGEGHSFTKETLEPAFAAHGTVTDCFVPDGKPFAFVTYDTLESAQAGGDALNMTEINGTKIFCNPALPKDGAGGSGGGGGRNCHKCNQPGHFAKDCTGAASSSSSAQSDWGAPAAASAGGSAWGSTTTTTAPTATESSGWGTPSMTAPAATSSGWGTPVASTSSSGGWGAAATPTATDVPSVPTPVVTVTSGWGGAPASESAKVEPVTSGWGSSSSTPAPASAAGGWGSSEPAVAAVSSGGWGSDAGTTSTSSWGGDAGSSAAPPARGGHSGRGRGRPMRGAPVLGPRGGYKLFVKLGEGHSFTKETLEPAFAAHGTVTDCFVPDGKPFAFITYDTLESAQAGGDALNMTEINGTKIFCNPALPKDGASGGGGGRNCHKCNQPGHFAKDCTGAASSSSSSQSDWGAPAAASAEGSAWGSTTTTTASTATESSGWGTPSTTAPAATSSGWGTSAAATSSSGGWGAAATQAAPDVPSVPTPVVAATSGWGEAPPTESAKVEPVTSGWGSSSSTPAPTATAGGWGSSEPAGAAVSSGGWGSDAGTASTSSWRGSSSESVSSAPSARGGHSGRGRGRP
ncbi:putative Transmembrane protein 26 [Hypsibius exemplaris]|uniref:Transmembrane protein 26 n=1 Tax=Hypsibius exemplaris TaxID=2072580 RepID=A0A1W0WCT8_HYPEX|nr:putative Transmembrane protein 26 [Hypsibius exemplaris]